MPKQPQVRVLPDALKAWRGERDLTQVELAKRVGCSETLIALIETGRRQPGYENAVAIADTLGVKLTAIAIVEPDDDPAETHPAVAS